MNMGYYDNLAAVRRRELKKYVLAHRRQRLRLTELRNAKIAHWIECFEHARHSREGGSS